MSNKYWEKYIYIIVYKLNRCPTKAMKETTPLEAWPTRKPHVGHLKNFGFVIYVLVSKEERTKLKFWIHYLCFSFKRRKDQIRC